QHLRRLLLPIAWLALALAFATVCMAATTRPVPDMALAPPKGVHVESAWVRAAPPGAMMLAGYMTLRNDGKTPARFDWAQSDVFGIVELHRTLIANGVSTMRLAGDQTIPAGGSLRFEPGGLHLMLMQAQHELKVGDKVRFRLHFADGTALDVVALVSAEAPGATTR
ncbi:MAG TPA: copper chaperone PCu(A)C, partial [Xanthomonadaceae bacterium]|nr:copper chaperone PCu(A)C [Xanthomonadaceae bacterium]